VLYLRRTLLANLQKPMLERSGFKRDVGRMGISHATVVSFNEQDELVLKPGARKPQATSRVDLANAAQKNPVGAAFGAPGSEGGQDLNYQPQPTIEGDASGFAGGLAGQFAGTGGPPGTIVVQPGQTPQGIDTTLYDPLHKTTFQIQFVYRPRPKADRDKPLENAPAADGTSADAAATN
jgi:hypothetical protein